MLMHMLGCECESLCLYWGCVCVEEINDVKVNVCMCVCVCVCVCWSECERVLGE